MRRAILTILCLASIAPLGNAQTVDRVKLRQSIELPAISTTLSVQFRSSERDGKGNKFSPDQKLADLQKMLKGNAEDAEIYLEQCAIYMECMADKKKEANDLLLKAEAVLRPRMQTTDAKEGILLTHYATVLEGIADNPWNDCEKWARRAVSVAPQDWRTWVYLAHCRHQQIPAILCGGSDKDLSKNNRTKEIIGMLILKRVDEKNVALAEKALDEALQCHDKAKQLAPDDPKRQEKRYGFRLAEIVMRNSINVFRGEKPAYPMMQHDRKMLDELQEVARLQTDHILWQSQLAHQLIMLGWRTGADKDGKTAKKFQPARPEDQQAINAALANIEKLAEAGKGETATYCYSTVAALHALMQDHVMLEKYARKSLAIDAKHQVAVEQLQQSLTAQGRHSDLLKAAQTHAGEAASARNCYLLAKALVLNNRHDLAEQACLAGLKLKAKGDGDSADLHCILGQVALMLRKSDDLTTLNAVRDILAKARRECRPGYADALLLECDYLAAIHQALAGEPAIALLKLQHLRDENPGVPRYEKALQSFSR